MMHINPMHHISQRQSFYSPEERAQWLTMEQECARTLQMMIALGVPALGMDEWSKWAEACFRLSSHLAYMLEE